MITYGSVCSGIESASVAWEPLGMAPAWFSEIEPFPCSVLAHHWPHVRNLGDMLTVASKVRSGEIDAPDVLVGGTPCQAFSLAGLRGGMADPRGQLTLTYVDILNAIDEQRPGREAACVWENVPGVLSSKDNAFGCFLASLCGEDEELKPPRQKWANAGCVYGPQRTVAWRVLDAQYFGVAQRRRRVFVVASARKDFDPCAVLFESEGLRRNTPPSREKGPGAAAATGGGTAGAAFRMTAFGEYSDDGTGSTLKARDYKDATDLAVSVAGQISHPLTTANNGKGCSEDGTGRGVPTIAVRTAQTSSNGWGVNTGGTAYTLDGAQGQGVVHKHAVRRLTHVECERLQGFPDGHTAVPHKGKPAADGPRYKALGNSKAVPVVRWVGRRLLSEINC